MHTNNLKTFLLICTVLLLIPFIAMQFTDEVNWGLMDFVVAGFLLLGTGLLIDLIIGKVDQPIKRIAICVAVVALLLLIWAELAVGIFT